MEEVDYLIVGSGINALVAAAMLAKEGHRVALYERNDRIGGCIRSEEIIAPGYIHDVMATTFALFLTSPAYAELGPDLERRGLRFAHTRTPTGVLMPDGRFTILSNQRDENVARLDALARGDGARWSLEMARLDRDAPFLFALLGGPLWSFATLRLLTGQAWRRGPRGLAAFFGEALGTARGWLDARFQSDLVKALLAPWVLHAGLTPESTFSAQMAKVIVYALEGAGAPVVCGGAQQFLLAFEKFIGDHGGAIHLNADVASVLLDGKGRARGLALSDGRNIRARKGVICGVTPAQLYGRLLAPDLVGPALAEASAAYRLGKGCMQIHYALSAAPAWSAAELGQVALIHLSGGIDSISKACNEAERGMLPAEPTICLGQPSVLDPSRCPPGGAILWLQLLEMPHCILGDAKGELAVPDGGAWNARIKEEYADRVEEILCRHLHGFRETVIGRKVYSPADLQTLNVNLLDGDPYGGACDLDQFLVWRPFPGSVNHRTHIPGLYHIGASTHPGPGLSGSSGYLLAKALH
jgi:phytoene dehydrogenase-like protein